MSETKPANADSGGTTRRRNLDTSDSPPGLKQRATRTPSPITMTCSKENGEKAVLPEVMMTSEVLMTLEATQDKHTTMFDASKNDSSSAIIGSINFDLFGVPNLLAMDLTNVNETYTSMDDQNVSVKSLFSNFEKLSVNESDTNHDAAKESSGSAFSSEIDMKKDTMTPETKRDLLLFLGDEDGDTPLHICIMQEDVRKSIQIINRAPDYEYLSIQNNSLQTPLHLAVLTNSSKLVRKLICSGADIQCPDKDGNTALHLACSHGHLEVVKQLLKPVTYGETLENKYPIPYMEIPQNMNVKNYEGLTCLHLAVLRQDVDIARLLLELDADPNVRDSRSGRSALHVAAEQGFLDCVWLLLRYRTTEIDIMNYAGHTPALLAHSRGHARVVQLLTHFGASNGFYYDSDNEEDGVSSDGSHSDMDM